MSQRMTAEEREKTLLRSIADAAKSLRHQWLSTMDYMIPQSEPLQKLFFAVKDLENFEREERAKLVEALRWIRDYQRDYDESLVEALNQVKCRAGDTLKELGLG